MHCRFVLLFMYFLNTTHLSHHQQWWCVLHIKLLFLSDVLHVCDNMVTLLVLSDCESLLSLLCIRICFAR